MPSRKRRPPRSVPHREAAKGTRAQLLAKWQPEAEALEATPQGLPAPLEALEEEAAQVAAFCRARWEARGLTLLCGATVIVERLMGSSASEHLSTLQVVVLTPSALPTLQA